MFAVRTNVHRWRCDFQRQLDECLEENGFTLINLPWHEYELLQNDVEHFTWNGYRNFVRDMAAFTRTLKGRVHVVTDSTVDYWNYDDDGNVTSDADELWVRLHQTQNLTIDSLSGSGFVALSDTGSHFRPRCRSSEKYDNIVLVGGWNDATYGIDRVRHAIRGITRPVRPSSH